MGNSPTQFFVPGMVPKKKTRCTWLHALRWYEHFETFRMIFRLQFLPDMVQKPARNTQVALLWLVKYLILKVPHRSTFRWNSFRLQPLSCWRLPHFMKAFCASPFNFFLHEPRPIDDFLLKGSLAAGIRPQVGTTASRKQEQLIEHQNLHVHW